MAGENELLNHQNPLPEEDSLEQTGPLEEQDRTVSKEAPQTNLNSAHGTVPATEAEELKHPEIVLHEDNVVHCTTPAAKAILDGIVLLRYRNSVSEATLTGPKAVWFYTFNPRDRDFVVQALPEGLC